MFIVVIGGQVLLPVLLAFIIAQRSGWSRWRIVLVAALPIPILMWGAALILLTMMFIAPGDVCDAADGCRGSLIGATVTTIVGAIMYALGAVFAFVGLHLGKQSPNEDLDDVFR